MKGTRPLDNDEIRSVSTCFTGNPFAARNSRLWFLLVIVELLIGCGGDTDIAYPVPAMLVEVKPASVRSGDTTYDRFNDIWYAEFDVVFEGMPADLEAEFELKMGVKEPFAANWEQTRNIVTLHFGFRLKTIEHRTGPTEPPDRILVLKREAQKQSVEVTLAWSVGRKFFTVEVFPPESMFIGRSDIF